MPRFEPVGVIEAHKTDGGDEYLLMLDGGFAGVLDATLFERVFQPAVDRRADAADRVPPPPQRSPAPAVPRGDLAAAIAARTAPDELHVGNGDHRASLSIAERKAAEQARVDQILEDTRSQVDRELTDRQAIDGGRVRMEPGQSAGRGKKVCKKCHIVNPAAVKKCVECGKAF